MDPQVSGDVGDRSLALKRQTDASLKQLWWVLRSSWHAGRLSFGADESTRWSLRGSRSGSVIGLGETWFLLGSAQGRQLIKRLVRLGRAFGATVLLDTHRIADLGDLADLIGVVFVFGQDSDDGAAAALRFIGLEPTRELIAHLRELRGGRCLMRDLHGRIGEVQVDLVYPHLLEAFATTPQLARSAA